MPYDALKAPDPQDWLDLDEQERIDQVIEYHRRHHLPMVDVVHEKGGDGGDINAKISRELAELTAASWRSG
jgi:hypothetical protein